MEVSIAILSDTQRTLGIERWLLGRKQYEHVRRKIVVDLLNRKPNYLILNGDLTAWGSSKAEWRHWREWMKPILESDIEIWPVMGNHDYLFGRRARSQFALQFPNYKAPFWYTKHLNDTCIIMLDSNPLNMSRENWEQQTAWFSETLAELDGDNRIHHIWVVSHHPCKMIKTLSTFFFESSKTEVWFSGHIHKLDDQLFRGKRLITFGGGGGAPHKENIQKEFGYILSSLNRVNAKLDERISFVRF